MSAAVYVPFETSGPGWQLTLHDGYAYLAIHPEHGDLSVAIESVLTPEQRPFWTFEYSHERTDDWSVWYLERMY